MGAEIGGETKESGFMQILMARLSRFSSDCISHLKYRWLVFKLDMWIGQIKNENFKAYSTHCRKGYHKLSNSYFKAYYKNSVWNVEFLECTVCRKYKFFSTVKDKRKYLRMTSSKRKNKWKEVEKILYG